MANSRHGTNLNKFDVWNTKFSSQLYQIFGWIFFGLGALTIVTMMVLSFLAQDIKVIEEISSYTYDILTIIGVILMLLGGLLMSEI